MDEFELIERYFKRRSAASGVVTGIGDDGAVLRPEPGHDQVQVMDTLVEGVHFPAGIDAADVGYRSVAVNLSDMAAMAAEPRFMSLALTLATQDTAWVAGFAEGLFAAADEFDVELIGGDTTRGDQLVATVHMTGDVDADSAVLRSGARVGDSVYVTGTFGDAAAGLSLLSDGDYDDELVGRFLRPSPRIEMGRYLAGRASAAIDVSDGLAGDLRKLLDASGVGGQIDVERVPVSTALESRFATGDRLRFALTGGDDYELCFTARPEAIEGIAGVTAIGLIIEGEGLVCRQRGVVVQIDDSGYRHRL